MTGMVGLVATQVTRPVFEGIGLAGRALFYALAAVATTVFIWGVWHASASTGSGGRRGAARSSGNRSPAGWGRSGRVPR